MVFLKVILFVDDDDDDNNDDDDGFDGLIITYCYECVDCLWIGTCIK